MSTIDASTARWSLDEAARQGKPLVVLLHGVGSHEGDLIGLAPYLSPDYAYVSLRAPDSFGGGFSWYPLAEPGAPRTADVDEAAAAVLAYLDSLGDAHPTVSLLGFSQGGSLALQLLRTAPARFGFAVVLAGFVVPGGEAGPDGVAPGANGGVANGNDGIGGVANSTGQDAAVTADKNLASAHVPVFYGHGDVDQVIPAAAVARTSAWLATHAAVEEHVYAGLAHGVAQEELADVAAFVARVTAVA